MRGPLRERGAGAEEEALDASTNRREFMKGTIATGMLGAVGMAVPSQSAGPPQRAADQGSGELAGIHLRPKAQLDGRFPATFNSSVPEGVRLLTQYFQGLNERNLEKMAGTLHFPFVTYEGTNAVIVESPEKLMADPPASMNVTGKGGDHLIKPGSYDILDSIQMHIYSPIGAGFSLEYSRYEANGHKIFGCHGLYGVTNNDGKWGVEYMSTIFKPADQIGRDDNYNFPIIGAAYHGNQRDHIEARRDGDVEDLYESVMDPYPHASVSIGGSNSAATRQGTPPNGFQVLGVKSRLRVEAGDPPTSTANDYGESQFANTAGGGVGVWANTIETPETRVLYASVDKGHMYAGYTRYTADGTVISEHRYLVVEFCRKGRWYGNDIATPFGHVMYRDHTNDVPG